MRFKKQPKRENLYTLNICYIDENGREKWTKWRNILYDNASSWRQTSRMLLEYYPGFKYGNLYGGISRDFKKQIKRDDL